MSTLTDDQIRARFGGRDLGVLVTHGESQHLLEGLLAEAARVGVSAQVFFMDEGVRLLADHQWVQRLPAAGLSACDLSVRSRGVDASPRVALAGQYHNALMIKSAARVVSL